MRQAGGKPGYANLKEIVMKRIKLFVVVVMAGLSMVLSGCVDGDGNGVGDGADALRKAECAVLDSAGSDFASGVCH